MRCECVGSSCPLTPRIHSASRHLGVYLSVYPSTRPGSRIPPVRYFHQEDVVRLSVQQPIHRLAELEVADVLVVRAALRPHEEDRRAREVLPPQHGVAAQRYEVEVGIAEGERIG